jgi:hypothetical protein
MEFQLRPALAAGLIGGLAMSAVRYVVGLVSPVLTMDVAHMWALMIKVPWLPAKAFGVAFHLLVSATIGALYGRAFGAVGARRDFGFWGFGAALVHWVLAGLFLSASPPLLVEGGEPVPAPGAFARNLGEREVVGFLFGHLLYGLTVGLAYGRLRRG